MSRSKLTWAILGCLLGAGAGVTTVLLAGGGPAIPISAEGMLVEASWNTDWQQPGHEKSREELEKTIEGSVSFKVDVALSKVQAHMQDSGTWGKISPSVSEYTATKVADTEGEVVYKIAQTVTPRKFPGMKALPPAKVNLVVTINKRAAREDAIVVRWTLDPEKPSDMWRRFNGRVFAADLHTGKSMVLVTTSTRSAYEGLPERLRLKLAEHYLSKTKDGIIGWLKGLN